nr:serine/threonine-protein kinase psk1 [Quercus suber]
MAPEVIQGHAYDFTVDWWSLGAIGFDLLTGSPPFSGNNHAKIQQNILKQKLVLPYFLGPDAKDLLTRLLRKEPNKRLGGTTKKELAALKAHRFFRKIDWKKLEQREVEPPIQPVITDPELAENFSKDFTDLPLSPVLTKSFAGLEDFVEAQEDRYAVAESNPFGGFSFVASQNSRGVQLDFVTIREDVLTRTQALSSNTGRIHKPADITVGHAYEATTWKAKERLTLLRLPSKQQEPTHTKSESLHREGRLPSDLLIWPQLPVKLCQGDELKFIMPRLSARGAICHPPLCLRADLSSPRHTFPSATPRFEFRARDSPPLLRASHFSFIRNRQLVANDVVRFHSAIVCTMNRLLFASWATTALAVPGFKGGKPDKYGGGGWNWGGHAQGEPSWTATQRADGVKEAFQHAWAG